MAKFLEIENIDFVKGPAPSDRKTLFVRSVKIIKINAGLIQDVRAADIDPKLQLDIDSFNLKASNLPLLTAAKFSSAADIETCIRMNNGEKYFTFGSPEEIVKAICSDANIASVVSSGPLVPEDRLIKHKMISLQAG